MSETELGPLVGASILVERKGLVLLVRRAKRAGYGLWSLPGGHVKRGEPVREAALRELAEETGVEAEIVRLIDCIDIIHRDARGVLEAHYVLSVFGALWRAGTARAGDDVSEVAWVTPAELDRYDMTPGTADFVRRSVPLVA